jgi:hypothetical protein
MLDGRGHHDANTEGAKLLPHMEDYVFAGLVTIAITLFAMGVMDVLAVMITTLSSMI